MNFGGSRVGVATTQTLVIRSTGDRALEIRNVDILNRGTEFTAAPGGDLDVTLEPSDELALRVTHTSVDGTEDRETLQIVSNAEQARVLVELSTEYKGVPALYIGDTPASNSSDVSLVNFGNVRAGVRATKTLYVKNRDRVIDGSVLELEEVRSDPISSTNFAITLGATVPTFVNQFDALCASDANCTRVAGDTCDEALGVCRTAGGALRDVFTIEVAFIGTALGVIEEDPSCRTTAVDAKSADLARSRERDGGVTEITRPIRFAEGSWASEERRVSIANRGTAPASLTSLALRRRGCLPLSLGGATFPLTIDAGATFELVVFDAPALGEHATVLTVASDAGSTRNHRRRLGAASTRRCSVTPSPIDFGDTHRKVGTDPAATVVLTVRHGWLRASRLSSRRRRASRTSPSIPSRLRRFLRARRRR